ncbi:ESX-1 secretion-associated protein EspI-like [Artibeus jamaicensis]|uniref:ESX-1 secretion-associated protein EspI-like n=1 Tax=Artibeus jamaicensis TaxID=9417 RepID=UPI00235A9336|nr:ESX-1 secretion-associated protein EspI-like [Artibeus jamaicensis]
MAAEVVVLHPAEVAIGCRDHGQQQNSRALSRLAFQNQAQPQFPKAAENSPAQQTRHASSGHLTTRANKRQPEGFLAAPSRSGPPPVLPPQQAPSWSVSHVPCPTSPVPSPPPPTFPCGPIPSEPTLTAPILLAWRSGFPPNADTLLSSPGCLLFFIMYAHPQPPREVRQSRGLRATGTASTKAPACREPEGECRTRGCRGPLGPRGLHHAAAAQLERR